MNTKINWAIGAACLAPMIANAAMVEMADTELGAVSGQAWIVETDHIEIRIDDLTERDLSLGPIDVSGILRSIEENRIGSRLLGRVRGAALGVLSGPVTLAAHQLRSMVPVLGRLPETHVRFETTPGVDP
jgi:hypothetical protein